MNRSNIILATFIAFISTHAPQTHGINHEAITLKADELRQLVLLTENQHVKELKQQLEFYTAANINFNINQPLDLALINNGTLLHLACIKGNPEIIELLLDHGAKNNTVDAKNWTPLHYACRENRIKAVELLLNSGANKDATKNDGWTPLHLACHNNNRPIVQILLAYGANKNIQSTKGKKTPRMLALKNNYAEIVTLLDIDCIALQEDTNCPICMEILALGDLCNKLSCKHMFHTACLKNWKEITCPMCRQATNFKHVDPAVSKKLVIIKKLDAN